MTKFGNDRRSSQELVYAAVEEALKDADMKPDKIDAAIVATEDSNFDGEHQRHYGPVLNGLLKKRVPVIRVSAVCGGGGTAFWSALNLKYNNVLVVGVERIVTTTTETLTAEILQAADKTWEQEEGLIFPAQNALVAQQHMLRYGTTPHDLALIAYKNHQNAFSNPKTAFFQKKVTLEQIEKSPMVASPLRLFDCTINVNGAAACIVSNDKSDVQVAGSGLASDFLATFEREDMTTWRATEIAAKTAFSQAGITPQDIDVAELHDAFTIVELIAYEDMGFCKKGEGSKLIRDGTVSLHGRLPVNTSGGLKARGHPISATGLAQIYEITKQLRDECKDRQVSHPKYGLTQNIGGAGGTVSVHILRKVSS